MSDQLDKLRKVKVPLWAKIMGAIRGRWRARQERKNAHLTSYYITTIYWWVWLTDVKYYGYIGYICYERGNKERYYEAMFRHMSPSSEKHNTTYGSTIAPWLAKSMTNDELWRRASATWHAPAIPQ